MSKNDRKVSVNAPFASSYMFIDNGQNAIGYPVSELTAHEFNHACQYTYGGEAIILDTNSYWYMEATAQWAQFALYGNGNWRAYVGAYLASPENGFLSYSMLAPNPLANGTVLFPKFIQERYGQDIVRASWEQIRNIRPATKALDSTLSSRGSTLSATFTDFARANYLKRYPANEFAWNFSVAMEPQLPSIGHPAAGQQKNQPDLRIGPLGVHYLAFTDTNLVPQLASRNATDGAILNVHFEFNDFRDQWTVVKFYRVRDPNLPNAEEIPAADITGTGGITDFLVRSFGKTYHQVVAVIANASWDINGSYQPPLQYQYRAEITPITVSVAADKTGIYNKGDRATFTVLVKDAYQQLFDPGKLSATLTTPSGTLSVALTRSNTGTYSLLYYLLPGTYTLSATATDHGNTGQAQTTINVQRIIWLADGTPSGYYTPGVPYRYYVTYYQRDNLPPAYVRVYVQPCQGFSGPCQPETYFTMQPEIPSDTNYTDGAKFVYDMPTDPTGQTVYFYHFQASDGTYTVSGEDPIVQPPSSTPSPDTSKPGRKTLSPKR